MNVIIYLKCNNVLNAWEINNGNMKKKKIKNRAVYEFFEWVEKLIHIF